jgi:hypothetical protein
VRREARLVGHQGAGLHLRLARRPHRAVEGRLGVDPDPGRQEPVRAGRVGPYRRRHQPAQGRQAQPLDQRQARRVRRCLAGRRHRASRQLVASLDTLAGRLRRRRAARAPGGRRPAVTSSKRPDRSLERGRKQHTPYRIISTGEKP